MGGVENSPLWQKANSITKSYDAQDGKDDLIKANTWKKFVVPKYGVPDNVRESISVALATDSIFKALQRTEGAEKGASGNSYIPAGTVNVAENKKLLSQIQQLGNFTSAISSGDITKMRTDTLRKMLKLVTICKERNIKVKLNSAYRDPEKQRRLHESTPATATTVENSKHVSGQAFDVEMKRNGVDISIKERIEIGHAAGLYNGQEWRGIDPRVSDSRTERWHFQTISPQQAPRLVKNEYQPSDDDPNFDIATQMEVLMASLYIDAPEQEGPSADFFA